MYITPHKASRLRKKHKCKLVYSKANKFDGFTFSCIKRKDFEQHADQWIKHPNVEAIWEGESIIIVAYNN